MGQSSLSRKEVKRVLSVCQVDGSPSFLPVLLLAESQYMGRQAYMNRLVNENPCTALPASVLGFPRSTPAGLGSHQLFGNTMRLLRSDRFHSGIPSSLYLLSSACASALKHRLCPFQPHRQTPLQGRLINRMISHTDAWEVKCCLCCQASEGN